MIIMGEFEGFPNRMQFTPVPNIVFSHLFPLISDINELKVLFYIFEIIYPKKGRLRFTSYNELLSNPALLNSLKAGARTASQPDVSSAEILRTALGALVQKGIILELVMRDGGPAEEVYFLNTAANKQAIEKIRSGEMALPGLEARAPAAVIAEEPSAIFTLYEQNIGMLTPMIAEELREAENLYPEAWIKDAIKEAVNQNIRKKSYILAILERWATEGKSDGTYKRDFKKTDPDKYIKGKYGHMVKR